MKNLKGQSALEYMLLLGTVMVIVLIGFKVYLPKTQTASDLFFKRASHGIAGPGPLCGDGKCVAAYENEAKCCVDCGGCIESGYDN